MKKTRSAIKRSLKVYRLKLILKSAFIFFIFSFVGTFLTSFIFFKVKSIECNVDTLYSSEELVEASDLKIGKNLFLINTNVSEKSISEKFPYLEDVKIIKKFPDKLIINAKTAKNYLNLKVDDYNVILSSNFKVLSVKNTDEDTENLIKVSGIRLKSYDVGKKAVFEDSDNEKNFLELLGLINDNDILLNIKEIDFSDSIGIKMNYDNRIYVNFGIYENMNYKLKISKEILTQKISSFEKGTLDLSMLSDNNRSYFTPES